MVNNNTSTSASTNTNTNTTIVVVVPDNFTSGSDRYKIPQCSAHMKRKFQAIVGQSTYDAVQFGR